MRRQELAALEARPSGGAAMAVRAHVHAPRSGEGPVEAPGAGRVDGRRRLRIGQAAAEIGVSPSALRLWERQGLVRPGRSEGGYRLYSPGDLDVLRRISRLRRVDKLNAAAIGRMLPQVPPASGTAERRQGERLRALRLARGLTLRRAAEAAGLSVSFISSVERGTSGASIAAIQRLTSSYGATLLDLFAEERPSGRLIRPAERPALDLGGAGIRIEQLSAGQTQMEPQLFVLAPGASSQGVYAHEGEELMFLLEGSLRVWLGDDEEYALAPGDALYFPSSLPHRWRNESDAETRLLWINTPPTF